MKNYKRKLCSLCAVLSLVLSTIASPCLFSVSTFASNIVTYPLGTINVPEQKEVIFPESCQVIGSGYNITYLVSSLNKLTSFIIRAVASDNTTFNPKFLGDAVNGTAKVKFTSDDKLNVFKVFNNDKSDIFNGSLKVEGKLPIQIDCSQTSSAISSAISSAFVAMVASITALFF